MEIWKVGNIGVPIGKRVTSAYVFKVRSVGDITMEVSGAAEFNEGADDGDGYTVETMTINIKDARKISEA